MKSSELSKKCNRQWNKRYGILAISVRQKKINRELILHESWIHFFSEKLTVPFNLFYNTVEDSIYNSENEILPGWYKRFGHILKVLTGKRTFRSLFRDDVKKHKD